VKITSKRLFSFLQWTSHCPSWWHPRRWYYAICFHTERILLNKSPFPWKKTLPSSGAPERLKFYQVLRKLSRTA